MIATPYPVGLSESSRALYVVERSIADSRIQTNLHLGRWARIYDAIIELKTLASVEGWDGEGSLPVSSDAISVTEQLLENLPSQLPLPEFGADSEGEVALDWFGPQKQSLSLSIDKNGRILFAGRVGAQPVRGKIPQYTGGFPSEVRAHLEGIFPERSINL
jgi:hypothetical protein